MANLLPKDGSREPFPAFGKVEQARVAERVARLVGAPWEALGPSLADVGRTLLHEVEELETAPSLAAAQALLASIDSERVQQLGDAPPSPGAPGSWVCYWPSRSEATGEAEVASRGFFDVQDRPPLGLWIEAIVRRSTPARSRFELAILCYVPHDVLPRARDGRAACRNGALAFLEEDTGPLLEQIEALVR